MAIYKQVMPEHNTNNEQTKQVIDNHSNTTTQMEDSDESFEYFSDKEEAEKHRKTEKQNLQ